MTTWHDGIFSMVSQPHSVQNLVEAHQQASVPLGRRRSWRNPSPGLLVPLSRAVVRCLQGMNYFLNTSARRRDGFIPVGQEEDELWRGEGERADPWRKERPLAPGRVLSWVLLAIPALQQWFSVWTSLSCVSPSTELISHASNRSHAEVGAFPGNFQRNIELVGAEANLCHNFSGETLHMILFCLC